MLDTQKDLALQSYEKKIVHTLREEKYENSHFIAGTKILFHQAPQNSLSIGRSRGLVAPPAKTILSNSLSNLGAG